jgi:hypothetical protein
MNAATGTASFRDGAQAPDPESRASCAERVALDSGFAPSARPGMTPELTA